MNTVKVMIRAKLDGKYPYLPAVIKSNGRVKPGVAMVGGVEQKVEGSYYLRFTEDGERRFVWVGDDAADALTAARKMEATLKATALGLVVKSSLPETRSERIKLADAIAEYKTETQEHKARRTYLNYAHALDLFAKRCPKTYVDEVERGCIMDFAAALKKDGNGERTVFNRFSYVYTFLKRYGKVGIVGKNDWPKFEETEAEIYSEDDVRKMLDACKTHEERTLILFASGTGFRHGEISHAEIDDFDVAEGTIQTRSKIKWKFTTKDHEQRIVPVSDSLIEAVKKHGKVVDGTLLFTTWKGNPNTHLDRIIVRIAKTAKVKVPSKPMHAFRALYATRLVRSGVDIYTVQRFLGHADVETTQGYLRAVKRNDPKLREQVNAASF
ncbi:MAG: site-specific integrase [Candidatus Acidiferrum sp.]